MTAKRRTPARKTAPALAPIFGKPQAKASTSSRSNGSRVSGSARIEVSLIRIGTLFSTSRTVNRAARGKGAGGFLARMLRNGSKALTQGAVAGIGASTSDRGDMVANGLTSEHSLGPLVPRKPRPGGAESFDRFKRHRPDLFDDASTEGDEPQ